MTWDEDQLRRSLKQDLHGVSVPAQIPTTTLMRARSRRFASLGATVAIVMLMGAAGAWGALSIDSDTPTPVVGPTVTPSFVRLVTADPTKGLIEIEPSKGQACYRFEMRGVTSAHIHHQGSDDVVVELLTNIAGNLGFLGCADGLDPGSLRSIAERPADHLVEFHAAGGGSEARSLSRAAGQVECLPTQITSSEYRLHFSATEGQPGDRVTVWGATLRTESGHYAPSERVELWWNAKTPHKNWPRNEDAQVIRLSTVTTRDRCYFLTSLTIPDVPDGRYQITGFRWDEPPSESYGVLPGIGFTVTSSSTDPPDCDDDRSYGRTIPGRWLEEVILNLGAPGSYEVTEEQVGDTGTALVIDIPEYDNDPTIYATMLTPGDDPNITSSPPREEVGKQGSYTLYLQKGNPWQSYKAVSAEWQLSLIAYPGADNDEVQWPSGVLEWLTRAAEIAERSPPRCEGPIS